MLYYDLPNIFDTFLKVPHNIQDYVVDKVGHHWGSYPTTDFITPEGIDWFNSNDINLKSNLFLFKCTPNYTGPIHLDGSSYAVNYILQGEGTMQWFNDPTNKEIIKYSLTTGEKYTFPVYNDSDDTKILDSWVGTKAVVKVNIPHRVVTEKQARVSVSIRFENGSFDQLVSAMIKDFG
jgi:hypothetical protein